MLDRSITSQMGQINVSKSQEKTIERVSEFWKNTTSQQKREIIELGDTNSSSVYRVTRIGNVSAKIVLALAQSCNVTPYYFTGQTDEPTKCTNALIIKFLSESGYAELANKLSKKQAKDTKNSQKDEDVFSNEVASNEVASNEIINEEDNEEENDEEEENFDAPVIEPDKLTDNDEGSADEEPQNEPADKAVIKDAVNAAFDQESICSDITDITTSIVNLFCSKRKEMTALQIKTIQALTAEDIDYLLKAANIKAKAGGNASAVYEIIKLLLLS